MKHGERSDGASRLVADDASCSKERININPVICFPPMFAYSWFELWQQPNEN